MNEIHDKLEVLFEKVRALPDEQRDLVAETLAELTASEPYQLSADELAVLLPELEAARRGEFATEAAVNAVLGTPWLSNRRP